MNLLKLFWGWPWAVLLMLLHLVFVIIPSLLLRLFCLGKASDFWLFTNTKLLSKIFLFFCGVRIHISGTENLEQLKKLQKEGKRVCLICNHTSMLDIPLIFGPLGIRCGFVAKKQLASVPYINLLALAMRCVFIDRECLKASRRSITKGVNRIKNGQAMLIFPEGTRSKTGQIGAFRYGAFRLATESNSIVYPIVIKGIRQVFEDRSRIFMNVDAYVQICDPVSMEKFTDRTCMIETEKTIETIIRNTYSLLGEKQEAL